MAARLRARGHDGEITLVGSEPVAPYQRPPLSKAYMAHGDADALTLKPAAFYDRSAITLRHGARAARIDRDARQVEMADGSRHGYDHLILATGARNFRPPIPGLEAAGVHELRTLADAARIRQALAQARHAIVIGGGAGDLFELLELLGGDLAIVQLKLLQVHLVHLVLARGRSSHVIVTRLPRKKVY